MHVDISVPHRMEQIEAPKTHVGECHDGGLDLEVYLVAGVLEAQIHLGSPQHEPEDTILVLSETELVA